MNIVVDNEIELPEEETAVKSQTEEDSPWKDILDLYLKDFFDFCLPEVSVQIDWTKKVISHEQELRKLTKYHLIGKRILDKLFSVFLKTGETQPIYLHLDVQGNKENLFPKRMCTYGYRGYDRFDRPIFSCAILTDNNKNWRPDFYEVGFGKTRLRYEFAVVKLLDYQDRIEEVEKSSNLFATVILVQLAAMRARSKPAGERLKIKLELTQKLYRKGFNEEKTQKLYIFIDWLLHLPKSLEIEYNIIISEIEEKQKMAYVTSAERIGIEKGIAQGLLLGREEGIQKGIQKGIHEGESLLLIKQLERKFGKIEVVHRQRINTADSATLLVWGMRLMDAKDINEVFNA